MKIIEKIFGIVTTNKIKLFIENNNFIKGIIYIIQKGDASDKFILSLLLMNLFIFNGLFSFIFVLVSDYLIFEYIKKLGKK